jgi:predicted TIM-barrel fold metal-dependent hydrolase
MKPLDEKCGPVHTDPDVVAERYEAAGIDHPVLSQPPYVGIDDVEAVEEANNKLIEVLDDYDQFYGLADLPVAAGGDAAAAELERALEMGYNGGFVETRSGDVDLDDEEMYPVFEVAEDYGAPLLVHPKIDNSLVEDDEVLDDTWRLNAIFGREAALQESISKVVHKGVYDEFEELNLVFHHLGGNIASMMGRIHLHLDMGRWPGQDHIKPMEEFKRQLEERVYVDSSGFFGYHAPVEAALEEFPSSQVVFGTDAPYEPRSADELAREADVVMHLASEHDSEAVLGGNALDLMVNT